MKIVLEGVDGSGKSTLGRILTERVEGVYYPTPSKLFRERREQIDAFASDEDHYRFYVEAVRFASEEIKTFAHTTHVIIDRYWLSTFIYHKVMGVAVKKEDFGEITEPDITILLTVDNATQLKRLNMRGMTVGDKRMLSRQQELKHAYEKHIYSIPAIIVDTSDEGPESLCEKIIKKLLLI